MLLWPKFIVLSLALQSELGQKWEECLQYMVKKFDAYKRSTNTSTAINFIILLCVLAKKNSFK